MKTIHSRFIFIIFVVLYASQCVMSVKNENGKENASMNEATREAKKMTSGKNQLETAILGGGCFWCIEAVFERLDGVVNAVSGYAGGTVADPDYEQVCTGSTGHAEVVQIEYDPKTISYDQILSVFFKAHDPTTSNRQGADVGSQYRSIILVHDDEQRKKAAAKIDELDREGAYGRKIVTEIRNFDRFYPAEEYHQDFYTKNPEYGYCRIVIEPKIRKLDLR